MRSTRWTVLVALAGVVSACGGKETAEQMTSRMNAESDSAMAAIRTKDTKFAAAFNNGQYDSVAGMYMELGRVMPPNDKSAVGRPAIKAMLVKMSADGTPHLSLAPTDVVANGPIAIERGTFVLQFTPKAGSKMPAASDTGKYLVHWQKVNGDWQLADDIFNSDMSMTPAAPTKAAPSKAPAKAPTKAPAKASSKSTKAPTKKSGR